VRRRLYYCDHHPIPLPPGHKFPIEKYARLRAILAADGAYEFEPSPPADRAVLELAHDASYVQAILTGTAGDRVMRRIGFPWSPELVRRTLASVGGTLAASRDLWPAVSAATWPEAPTTPFVAKAPVSACSTISLWPFSPCAATVSPLAPPS
jgi:acetoin utilization deacetylase AcuC-like enzyme